MSLKPVSIAFVWSICLFWASRNISAERSNLSLSCSILRFHISITAVWNSPAEDPLSSGSSRRRRFPLTATLFCGFVVCLLFTRVGAQILGWWTAFLRNIFTFYWASFLLCTSKDGASFNGHFCRIYAVAMPHYFVKIIKIWKAIFDDFYSSFSGLLSSLF